MSETPETSPNNTTEPPPATRRPKLTFALILGLLLLTATLRLHNLGGRDLWVDEANGVLMSQGSLPELFTRLKLDSSPPLYYIILHGWMRIFDHSEVNLRLISVIAALAVVASVFLIGRRWFSLETATIAAVLIATSPIHIFYSQQARMYVLLALPALWSFHFLWRAISEQRRIFLVAYALATLAALYTHNHALYLLPAHAAIIIRSGALRRKTAAWLICAAGIVIGYLPWLPTLLAQINNHTHYSWFLPFWEKNGVAGSLLGTLQSFSPGGTQPIYVSLSGLSKGGTIVTTVFGLLAALGMLRVFRRRSATTDNKSLIWLCLSYTCIPLFAALAASSLLTPNYVPGRCDQLVFPGFVMLVAVGLTCIRPPPLRYLILLALLVSSGLTVKQYYYGYPTLADRAMAVEITRRARPEDAVLCTSLTRASLEYLSRALQCPGHNLLLSARYRLSPWQPGRSRPATQPGQTAQASAHRRGGHQNRRRSQRPFLSGHDRR